MNINELFDIIDYAIKFYKDEKYGTRFGIWEYYSLTNFTPEELSKLSTQHKRGRFSAKLGFFAEQHRWGLCESDLQKRINFFHSVNGYELTPEDKMNVFDKLKQEGYPLVEEIIDKGFSRYVKDGIDSISMEDTRNKIISSYAKYNPSYGQANISSNSPKEENVAFVKQIGKVSK